MCINSDIEVCEVVVWLYFFIIFLFYKFNCDCYSKGDCRKKLLLCCYFKN